MSFEMVAVTAMAYTLMTSDDHKRIAVLAPLARITIPVPTGFPEKFCVKLANAGHEKIVFVVGLTADPVVLWPQTETPVAIKDGHWTTKEPCE